ncbi:hypothetical protein IEN85_10190 [Pelagicoccus sp. NFK12]|uniref:Uncharacterized protein n=1 Tax=Pelagicoccus enzymogenes TaxID=2773457 RepID=A0A927F7G2_9BACT|nr:hypothetical protein [Pelagicoccus enzymogenes]MBD5779858.1 hypothetical protein [Pelagicoccus enzymogenes]
MMIRIITLFLICIPACAFADEWVPVISEHNGYTIVNLLGRDEPVVLENGIVVRQICRSKKGNDFILELVERKSLGDYEYGALVCEWDESEIDWKVYYRVMKPDMILKFGARAGLSYVYNGFESLEEVMIILGHEEHRELPAGYIRTWKIWDFVEDEEVRTLSDDEVPGGWPKLIENK